MESKNTGKPLNSSLGTIKINFHALSRASKIRLQINKGTEDKKRETVRIRLYLQYI